MNVYTSLLFIRIWCDRKMEIKKKLRLLYIQEHIDKYHIKGSDYAKYK